MRHRLALALCLLPSLALADPDLRGIGYDQRVGARLPVAALFRDEAGKPITLGAAIGDTPAVIDLGYFHCPALCGVVRADLMAALAASGLATPADYHLIALSIDPAETPADAATAKAGDLARTPTPGAATGWHYLTGNPAAVMAAVGLHARWDAGLRQFIHPAGLVIATPGGRVSAYLLGVGYHAGDLRAALLRARMGGIARAALPILLLCFHFDPLTGRYSLAIIRIIRLIAGLFVVTLATLLVLARRRERPIV